MITYSKHRFHTLDGMRGIAAVLVMLYHYYSAQAFAMFSNTYIAVDFFFALSGFVIAHSYGDKLSSGMKPTEYLARRVGRLYPMMAIGIFLGIPTLIVQIRSGMSDLSLRELVAACLGNLFMLPFLNNKTKIFADGRSVTGQLFPADDPLWSIFAEMIASVLFLVLVRFSVARLIKFCAWSSFFFVLAALVNGLISYRIFDVDMGWDTHSLIGLFPRVSFGFSCGVLLHRLRETKQSIFGFRIFYFAKQCSPALIYACLLIALLFPIGVMGLYAVGAVLIFAPALVALGAESVTTSNALGQASNFLGWISFPVYCLHRPIISALQVSDSAGTSWVNVHGHMQAAAIIATLGVSVLVAWSLDKLRIQQRFTRSLEFALRNWL